MELHTFPPPAGTLAGPQQPSASIGNRSASLLSAAVGHGVWGSHITHTQNPKYTGVYSYEKVASEALRATRTMGSFLQHVLNSCQSLGIGGQNISSLSSVIPESLIWVLWLPGFQWLPGRRCSAMFAPH